MPAFAIPEPAPGSTLEHADARQLLSSQAGLHAGAALVLAGLSIFALGRYTDVDLRLADALYDRAAGAFPWRDAWLTATFNHTIMKAALTVLALLFIAAALFDAARPQARLDPLHARLRLRVVAWSAVLVPLVTSLLKQASEAHCPWDLARYGGAQPYIRLFEALPAGALPGHCLPAGHASSALWLVSLAVWWLPGRPQAAWRAAGAALGFGMLVGWMQQLRGAHFLTHTLWSAWIACALVLALALLLQAGAAHRLAPTGGRPRRVAAGTRWRAP